MKIKDKLKDFPVVYWINLEHDINRKKYMINKFNTFGIDNIRIEGTKKPDKSKYSFNNNFNPYMINIIINFIRIMELIVENKHKNAIIMEDDIGFGFWRYIPFTWKDYENKFGDNIIQLCSTSQVFFPELRDVNGRYFGTQSTFITLNKAINFLNKIEYKGKYIINTDSPKNFLYATLSSKIVTLFYHYTKKSNVHGDCYLNKYNINSIEQLNRWKNINYKWK